jgi:hypothetical protein
MARCIGKNTLKKKKIAAQYFGLLTPYSLHPFKNQGELFKPNPHPHPPPPIRRWAIGEGFIALERYPDEGFSTEFNFLTVQHPAALNNCGYI